MKAKFDLFDALEHMKATFNHDGEIILKSNKDGIIISLRVLMDNRILGGDFMVSNENIYNGRVSTLNIMFHDAIKSLETKRTKYKESGGKG